MEVPSFSQSVSGIPSQSNIPSSVNLVFKPYPVSSVEEKKELHEEPDTRLIILHSKEIPADVMSVFQSIGKVIHFDYKVHSMLSLEDIDFQYLLIDITKSDSRQWLRLHRKEFEAFPNVLAYCYSFEVDSLERPDSWMKFSKKVITNFDLVVGSATHLAESLMSDKIKYQNKVSSFVKHFLSCWGSQ